VTLRSELSNSSGVLEFVLRRLLALPEQQHALFLGNVANVLTTFGIIETEPRPKSDGAQIRKLWFICDSKVMVLSQAGDNANM